MEERGPAPHIPALKVHTGVVSTHTFLDTHTHRDVLASVAFIFQTESECDARDLWVYNRISTQ